jgi:hypothetical protein
MKFDLTQAIASQKLAEKAAPQIDRNAKPPEKGAASDVPVVAGAFAPISQVGASPPTTTPIVASHATQDQTTLYEEYLFGKATYADGKRQKLWSDSTKGRIGVRLIARGVLGAAAFTWGGRVAGRQLVNYSPETFRFSVASVKKAPLQAVAKSFDTVLGAPIKAFIRKVASGNNADVVANRAVRFRQKAYYHSEPGKLPGRSLGAEMVAISFDFACASTADATGRNMIQLFDPNIQKPWIKDGKFSVTEAAKNTLNSSWRIFSKNQGEDWAAALPYIFQMKLQRKGLSKMFPGLKAPLDAHINGGSFKVNMAGKVIGDYQKAGAMDLQMRFMGYNWYTLIYREMYDNIHYGFKQWRENNYKIEISDNPVAALAEKAAYATRYVAKSVIKATMYMLPSVPFFWMFRTPQSKWRSPMVVEPKAMENLGSEIAVNGVGNSYVMEKPHDFRGDVHLNREVNAHEINANTLKGAIPPGGIHTNPTSRVTKGYIGTREVNITPMGGDEAFKWKNQKTLFAKILNPFGWISYKAGSGLVHMGDALARNPRGLMARMMPSGAANREGMLRTFADASFAYTPYMIAKTEFALRVDDRGAKREIGAMDKAIYKGIDSFVTLDMKGVGDASRKVGNLLFNHEATMQAQADEAAKAGKNAQGTPPNKQPTQAVEASKDEAAKADKTDAKGGVVDVATNALPKTSIQAASVSIPSLKTDTAEALTHPKLKADAVEKNWEDSLKQESKGKQTFLYPESRTIQ